MTIQIYVDGSTNGFDSCICFIIKGGCLKKSQRKQVFTFEKLPAQVTEYLALIKVLEFMNENHFSKRKLKIIYTDSYQLFNEMNNRYCSRYTINYKKQAIELLKNLENVKIIRIKRENNLAGIHLEKRLNKIKNSLRKYG